MIWNEWASGDVSDRGIFSSSLLFNCEFRQATLRYEVTTLAPRHSPTSRSIWDSRAFRVAYSSLFAAVIVLASVSVYYDFFPASSPGTSAPTFTIDNVTLSFAGPSPSNLTSAVSWCARCWEGTYAVAGTLRIYVGVALAPAAASCTHLSETKLYEVDTPRTGKFQIENVSWGGTSLPRSGYLPARLPYGNLTVCDSVIDLLVSLSYTPPGPINETLSLTVDWTYATVIVP